MSLFSFAPGWNLQVPAGTVLVRADVVMHRRPGAGGYCAVIEAADQKDVVVIRGGDPNSDTERMIHLLGTRLSDEIHGNRAVILTRTAPMHQRFGSYFKPFKMIRLIGHSPLAVADATRHAAVMAERSRYVEDPPFERFEISRYEINPEEHNEKQDTSTVHDALQTLLTMVSHDDLRRPSVQKAAQDFLDAVQHEHLAHHQDAISKMTAHDIPWPTRAKKEK